MLKTGDILKFNLEHSLGSALCLIEDYTTEDSLITVLVKVFDTFQYEVPENISEINSLPLLINPIRIYEYPNTRGRGAWRKVGFTDTKKEPLPLFKRLPLMARTNVDESKCLTWRVLKNFHQEYKEGKQDTFDYKRIGHLEQEKIYYKDEIITRATMEVIKLKGEAIEDYYDILKFKYAWTYLRSINVPFQKDIPEKYKSRIIPEEDLNSFKGIPFRTPEANPKPPKYFPENPMDLRN